MPCFPRMPARHDNTDLDATRVSRIGKPLLGLLVRSFSTTSRPACGRPPPAAALSRHGALMGQVAVVNISELRLQFMGWESQWSRVQRDARRTHQAVEGDPTADAWDDVINFFIHACSLLDWPESDGLITTAKKRQLIAQTPLSVARDIANAAKHDT